MTPLVTISIPLYNCEKHLEKCLTSVLNQTYKNIEVTLINDQTPDNSVKIAEQFIQQNDLKNWTIIHFEKNAGLSVVRNKGIDTANGKYLYFLDSDDTITEDCIDKLVEVAERENVEMVISNTESVKLPSKQRNPIFTISEKKDVLKGNQVIFESFISGKIPAHSWNKLIDLKFLKKNKLYFIEGLYAQDILHSFHTVLKLQSVAFCRNITYTYFLHEESVIHNRGKRHFDNWFTIGQYIDKALKEEKNLERRRLILQYLIKYKNTTLIMNWRAQKNEELWKETYNNYQTLSSLSLLDYFSTKYSNQIKKMNVLQNLPINLGLRIFKKRWES